MDSSVFRDMAIQSAQTYYRFLADNGKGVASVAVQRIAAAESGAFLLILRSRLSAASAASLDTLQFRINGTDYTSHQIAPVKYSAVNATLLVKPSASTAITLSTLDPKKLFVISDLKFLVKRVEDWYTAHGHTIAPPPSPPPFPREHIFYAAEPSEEQKQAVLGALSSGLSYIWGAPGTGKTRVVLASCVVSLLNAGKKVLLLAPTNNALEQMLLALMPALLDAGIPQDEVLRLGTPTAQFAERYPDICEYYDVSRQLSQVTADIKQIESCLKYRRSRTKFEVARGQIFSLLAQLEKCADTYLLEKQALDRLSLSGAEHRAKDKLLRRTALQQLSALEAAQRALTGPGSSIKKHLVPGWYARRRSAEEAAAHKLQETTAQIEALAAVLTGLALQQTEHHRRLNALTADFSHLKANLLEAAGIWQPLCAAAEMVVISDFSGSSQALCSAISKGTQHITNKTKAHAAFYGRSEAELAALLRELSEKAERLQSASTEDRLKNVSIVAATADRFIAMPVPPAPFCPDHMFLDEAGYCSLIKGASLLSLGIPTTLLGDHMQLPPVCETDDAALEEQAYHCVCLWKQSSIHIDSIFLSSPAQLCHSYLAADAPPFHLLEKYELTRTFRFGSTLADILAGYVYASNFHSTDPLGTELLILDAPRRKEADLRVNTAEVAAIADYLKAASIGDFAILTAYRKQVAALSDQFRSVGRDGRILTIHASQGQEWDTVIFSVVDTHRMYFVDSLNPKAKGKQVVNTAVSRARKRLVIVCDYDYWRAQPNQLVSHLVRAAKLIPHHRPDAN